MDIKTIIVRDYLESLTESEELDYIFPLFLESQGFIILSKPTESRGLSQYGKDVVAVGNDFEDGIKKRFYFQLKGGEDKDITSETFIRKKDGILESLREAKYRKFEFINKEHEKLPLKIVLVHNGELKMSVRDTFDGFVNTEFPKTETIKFDRWGISELTQFFTEKFFGEFLLADKDVTKLFNKTLVNLEVEEKVSNNFEKLLDVLFANVTKGEYKRKLPRKWKMMFESLRLIAFIIYTESKNEYNNLDIAKRYLTRLVIRFWYWVLKNKLETDKQITQYVDKVLDFYRLVLNEYFQRTLPIAQLKDGLFAETGGRYEQVGYTFRTFEYLQYLCWFLKLSPNKDVLKEHVRKFLIPVLNANNVSIRPLIDIHSIPIIDTLKLLIETENEKSAENYLSGILFFLKLGKEKYNRFPDANNSKKNVVRFIATGEKAIDYSDSTSLLLAVLMEFMVILNIKNKYEEIKGFINKSKIDIEVFIPHHGINSSSKHLIKDKENDLEEQLFSKYFFDDGYQCTINLHKNFGEDLSFEEFKEQIVLQKDEFTYEYRTDKAGYSCLKDLAHIYFRTPYFPDRWRCLF